MFGKSENRSSKPKARSPFYFGLRTSDFRLFMPSLIWLITIAVLSGYPGNKIPKSPFLNFDKLVHVGIYFVLSATLCYWQNKSNANECKSFKISLLVVLFGIFYGGLMEILQEYIFINRSSNWYDFFSNTVGTILGVVLFPFVLKLLPFKR